MNSTSIKKEIYNSNKKHKVTRISDVPKKYYMYYRFF